MSGNSSIIIASMGIIAAVLGCIKAIIELRKVYIRKFGHKNDNEKNNQGVLASLNSLQRMKRT